MGLWRDHLLPRLVNWGLDNEEAAELRRRTAAPLAGEVLEVGFGSGLNLPHLPEAVTRVHAVDPAVVGRRLARTRLAESRVPVEFVGLDGETLPLPDASVDAALTTWTLCTIPDTARALAEIARVLKPGGRLHFLEHGRSPEPRVARWQDRLNGVQRFCCGGCRLNLAIDEVIAATGFDIASLEHPTMDSAPKVAGYLYQGVAVRPD